LIGQKQDVVIGATQRGGDVGRVEAKPDPPQIGGLRLRLTRPTASSVTASSQ
jgi:hypothetical protein